MVVLPITQQGYQHEYVDQPKMSEVVAQMALEDQAATLEYKTIKEHLSSKSPNHGVNLVENLDSLPPKFHSVRPLWVPREPHCPRPA